MPCPYSNKTESPLLAGFFHTILVTSLYLASFLFKRLHGIDERTDIGLCLCL